MRIRGVYRSWGGHPGSITFGQTSPTGSFDSILRNTTICSLLVKNRRPCERLGCATVSQTHATDNRHASPPGLAQLLASSHPLPLSLTWFPATCWRHVPPRRVVGNTIPLSNLFPGEARTHPASHKPWVPAFFTKEGNVLVCIKESRAAPGKGRR